MKINIGICDDQEFAITFLENLLRKNILLNKYEYKIYKYTSAKYMFADLKNNNINFHMIFLDIELGNDSFGTDVGTQLKEINPDILLIYVSGYECFYSQLVKAEPFDFLEKTVDEINFNKTLERAINRLLHLNHDYTYMYKFNGITFIIDLQNVIYFESRHRVILIHKSNGDIAKFYAKLDEVEKEIESIYPYFARATKSYYVNIKYATRISNFEIKIGDLELKISSKYKLDFHTKMMNLLVND